MDGALAVLDGAISQCLAVPLWARTPEEVVGYLDRVQVVEQRLAALKLALIRQVDSLDVARHDGAANTVSWLRDRHRVSGGAASRAVKLACTLDADLPAVSGALAAGAVNTEQAQVITAAVDRVPDQVRQAAEQRLIADAATFGPRELGRLSERILDHVAPDLARQRTENELAALEREAHDGRRLFLVDIPGTCRVRIHGQLDRKAPHSYAPPWTR